MPLAPRFKSTLLDERTRYGHNNQINSHGFTLSYDAMLVIRNILKRILTCTNIVKRDLNSLLTRVKIPP